jgi:hypothetical protein
VQLTEGKLDDLVKLKPLVEEKPVEFSVRLGLNPGEEKNSPQLDPQRFPLQLVSKG